MSAEHTMKGSKKQTAATGKGAKVGKAKQSARGSVAMELPQLVACVGNCGFYGNAAQHNLCSKCFKQVTENAHKLSDSTAINYLLRRTGIKTLDDVKKLVCIQMAYPDSATTTEKAVDKLKGVTTWLTSLHPLTQFDKIPQRGLSACTYIAGVAALRLIMRSEMPDEATWSDSINRGVRAFHEARAAKAYLQGASNLMEALPYILPTLGRAPRSNVADITEHVVALMKTEDMPLKEFLPLLGENGYPVIGKDGLVKCVQGIFQRYDKAQSMEFALVITRPPETYCVLQSEFGSVAFRDSHRRKQTDFADWRVFLKWLKKDNAFSQPLAGCPLLMNQVGLYEVRTKAVPSSSA